VDLVIIVVYMFDSATALCHILYKRLRNTLTFLLIKNSDNDDDDD